MKQLHCRTYVPIAFDTTHRITSRRGHGGTQRHPLLKACASQTQPDDIRALPAWATIEFRRLVLDDDHQPRPTFDLLKACMLVALEEEAAGACRTMATKNRRQGRDYSHPNTNHPRIGAAATWSLACLDALAADTLAEFRRLVSTSSSDTTSAIEAENNEESLSHASLVVEYPARLITALNTVLFDRQGYRRMLRHGDPRDNSLGQLLERGSGGAGTLAILYAALAARCGVPLAVTPLDDGRFFALWPADPTVQARFGAGGEKFVIDPYSRGSVMSEVEVVELFGAVLPLKAATSAEVLAAVLAPLRDAYWCEALQCPPEPAFMVPLCTELALEGRCTEVEITMPLLDGTDDADMLLSNFKEGEGPLHLVSHALERAAAAAHKRRVLLPEDAEAALHMGLIFYFQREYQKAMPELHDAMNLMKRQNGEGRWTHELDRLAVLCEKTRLLAGTWSVNRSN